MWCVWCGVVMNRAHLHLDSLWNDVFNLSQDYLGIPRGTIRGTVLIETILASFEMEEIIFELREHSSGLNCGRWDCKCRPGGMKHDL